MTVPSYADDLGLYVHVPFCERVCPYCDFAVEASGRLDAERGAHYVAGLLRELELWRASAPELFERPLASVYLGGGTPSLLEPEQVGRLLEGLRAPFRDERAEVTLELNPGVLEAGRAAGFRAAGVTRASLGVQSLHAATLRRLGRGHTARDARSGLEACLEAGFDSLSADLILGAPGQSLAEVEADVSSLLDLGVPHVSAYTLTLEPGTPFHTAHERGRLELPDEDVQLAMSRSVRALLTAGGLTRYEISSFARPGHRSRHNQRYWLRRPFLGLGVSAASQFGDRRLRNAPTRGAWRALLDRGHLPSVESESVGGEAARRETLYLGLRRLEGVARSAYRRRFGSSPEADFPSQIRELQALGLLHSEAGSLRLTERGILFADEVFLRFVPS